jgi:hypothetical protein
MTDIAMLLKSVMRLLIILFFFIILIGIALAQQIDSKNTRPLGGRNVASDSSINERFKRHNITEEKLVKLKALGLDLREHLSHSHNADERVDAAMLDMVIIGKVLSIKDTLCPDTEPFHSRVNVQIIDLLKGPKQQGNTIELLRQSGVELYQGGTRKVAVSTDPPFTVGDTSVFYIGRIVDDPYLTSVYKDYFSKRKSMNEIPEYWVRAVNKHNIINSLVDYYGYYIPVDSFRVEIKNVAHIVDGL